jgi:hypothetical protein
LRTVSLLSQNQLLNLLQLILHSYLNHRIFALIHNNI